MGKHEDQLRLRGTFMALKSVKKDRVGGHAEPWAKQEKQRMVLWGDGVLRGSGIQREETVVGNWVHGEGPSGKASKKTSQWCF